MGLHQLAASRGLHQPPSEQTAAAEFHQPRASVKRKNKNQQIKKHVPFEPIWFDRTVRTNNLTNVCRTVRNNNLVRPGRKTIGTNGPFDVSFERAVRAILLCRTVHSKQTVWFERPGRTKQFGERTGGGGSLVLYDLLAVVLSSGPSSPVAQFHCSRSQEDGSAT